MEPKYLVNHEHPVVLIETQSHDDGWECWCCSTLMQDPSFYCVKCEVSFNLERAERFDQVRNHPFHRKHGEISLNYWSNDTGTCNFCNTACSRHFFYCPDCDFRLHNYCAFLQKKYAGEFVELQHKEHEHPLVFIENSKKKIEKAVCYCCSKQLGGSVFVCVDCKFYLHKNCALPEKINHPCHRKHSLILHATAFEPVSCKVCQTTENKQLFYRCSPCNFDLHIECVSVPSPIVDNASHQHPFNCLLRQLSFICDICGIEGDCAPYQCHTCNLLVHKKCISLPRTFKIKRHRDLLSHTYSLEENEFRKWDCKICHNELNAEHGNYNCSDCKYVVHVNCAIDVADSDGLVEPKDKDVKSSKHLVSFLDESITFTVIKEVKLEEHTITTEIRHFSHVHNLTLSDEIGDDKCCNGCMLPISTSFYSCSVCDFFLDKSCAELPREEHHWFHPHPFKLFSDSIFKCNWCHYECSGLSYHCSKCDMKLCLRCKGISEEYKNQAHEHPLLFYDEYEGKCNACSGHIDYAFKCKDCNFALDIHCPNLPHSARHKCDQHLLTLTFRDDDNDPLNHYCDICEEKRYPNQWYYYCKICDNSVHPKCVLGKYPFIKLGSYYRDKHLHLLTFVQKCYYYPECFKCGKPCQDLALECTELGCKYIVHWECIKPSRLIFTEEMEMQKMKGI